MTDHYQFSTRLSGNNETNTALLTLLKLKEAMLQTVGDSCNVSSMGTVFIIYSWIYMYLDTGTILIFFPLYTPTIDLKKSHHDVIDIQIFSCNSRSFKIHINSLEITTIFIHSPFIVTGSKVTMQLTDNQSVIRGKFAENCVTVPLFIKPTVHRFTPVHFVLD